MTRTATLLAAALFVVYVPGQATIVLSRAGVSLIGDLAPGRASRHGLAKLPDAVINSALAQGVNLRVETKYWMEQMGLHTACSR